MRAHPPWAAEARELPRPRVKALNGPASVSAAPGLFLAEARRLGAFFSKRFQFAPRQKGNFVFINGARRPDRYGVRARFDARMLRCALLMFFRDGQHRVQL